MSVERRIDYIMHMRPLLDKDAVFSDKTESFVTPSEPDADARVRIRIRTARDNLDSVTLVCADPVVLSPEERSHLDYEPPAERIPMSVAFSHSGFDYYEASVTMGDRPFRYYFELRLGNIVCYYDQFGLTRDIRPERAFSVVPGFHTPDWAKGAVMYQIFVDRFCNGDPDNDVRTDEYSYIDQHVRQVEDWYQPITGMDVRNFYGGDLQGVIDKLDYLADLGIEAIYLNPIFVSPSNHKYDIQDYDHVDPHFGKIVSETDGELEEWDHDNTHAARYISRVTGLDNLEAGNQLFVRLVEETHRRNMKVILDGVFNHCGSFNKWMDRERIYEGKEGFMPGAYVSRESPYHDYFRFFADQWPYNEEYDGWWNHRTLPKLNYEDSERLQKEIYRIARKWVSPPYNADGWRLDVAADLGHSPEFNHAFWQQFRKEVKQANPEALIVAEHYGDAASWLQGDQWDTVMNYDAFMEPITWFLTGMEKHSDAYREDMLGNDYSFCEAMRYNMAHLHTQSLLTAMNELDNHDHSRFLTRTSHKVGRVEMCGPESAEENVDKAVMREAVVFQMTWPGAPTLYYGDEAGVCGYTDPDNRRPYPWGREDRQMIRFYKAVISLHRNYPVLRTGSTLMLYHEWNVLVYSRFTETERIIVAINNRDQEVQADVPVWMAGVSRSESEVKLHCVFETDNSGYSTRRHSMCVSGGILRLRLGPKSSVVLYHTDIKRDKNGKIKQDLRETYHYRGRRPYAAPRQSGRKNLQTIRK
ncbi:MAG: glycoside hydrolase family 13 protein [Eubacterium sp.]|nr:glycoside hydrolase family 13 protein [Eubacterium sp.]